MWKIILALALSLIAGSALAAAGDGPGNREGQASKAAQEKDAEAIDRLLRAQTAYHGWARAAQEIQRGGYGLGDSSCSCGPNIVAGR